MTGGGFALAAQGFRTAPLDLDLSEPSGSRQFLRHIVGSENDRNSDEEKMKEMMKKKEST